MGEETFVWALCENLKERDFFGNLDTDLRVTLKLPLRNRMTVRGLG